MGVTSKPATENSNTKGASSSETKDAASSNGGGGNSENAIEVGTSIQARRHDGTYHTAEVIHRRLINENGSSKKSASGGSGSGGEKQDIYEYYIHFEGFNRRLDLWVRRDSIRLLNEDVGDVRF